MNFELNSPKLEAKYNYRMKGQFGFLGIDGTGNGTLTMRQLNKNMSNDLQFITIFTVFY